MKRDDAQVLALKVPPHSNESEQAVLGALLIDNSAYEKVADLIVAEDFYKDDHRRIYRHVSRLIEASKAADVVTVGASMDASEDAGRYGGLAYLGALAESTPSAVNIRRYAELVRERSIQRQLATAGTEIAEDALGSAPDVMALLEQAEAKIMSVRDQRRTASDVVHVAQACTEYLDWIEEHPNGIEMGLRDLDALTGGLLPGSFVVIAGRPSMGKTALALQAVEHICTRVPGLMFSLDQTRREVAGRLVEWHRHRAGRDGAVDKVFNLRFFVDETPGLTIAAMRAKLRRTVREHGCSLVVVDYIQQMRAKGETREQEVAFISRELKAIAKDFKVPVLALAQLNRAVDQRGDKRPGMSDLRESGAIEQDADLILFPFRPDYYDPRFQAPLAEAEIIVAKNKNNGRTGLAKVMFSRDLNRFGDYIPGYEAAA